MTGPMRRRDAQNLVIVAPRRPPAMDVAPRLAYLRPVPGQDSLDENQWRAGMVAIPRQAGPTSSLRMELHQVRYFLALCKTLNFTRAAEACNVTQPALTRAIQKLEDELGGPLFYRERNLTQLTELGRSLKPHLETTLAAAEAAKRYAEGMRKKEIAVLRLGLAYGVGAGLVLDSVSEVARRIPALDLHLAEGGTPALSEALLQGEVDAALLVRHGALPEKFNAWPMLEQECRVVFPATHRLAKLRAIAPPDLADEGVIALGGDGAPSDDGGGQAALRIKHTATSAEHAQHLVKGGFGVALLPEACAVIEGLEARPLEAPELRRPIVLAVVAGRLFSPALDAFVRLMRARSFAPAERAAA
jgi:DNA-binding transcriptional LysR family regulator